MIIMAQTLKSFETRIRPKPPEKETIHSGHFMVSKFEAEEPDDDDDVAVPVPDAMLNKANMNLQAVQSVTAVCSSTCKIPNIPGQSIAIETSLAKLFQCMSLAYRQKLTSPKWNRFKGIKLRWKDKIRLNNVIWRCWHMQFITKKNSLVCQFASPLDVDTHNKPEAVVLEGKYWKRKLNAVTAEYKKWRMFYRNQLLGWGPRDCQDMISEMDFLDWQPHSNDSNMMVDEDYMEFMSDTLFSSISAQPFAFPDPREIARGAGLWADLIQPSLVQLQPNLDDDVMDTLEPLHDLLCSKLPPVPEEISTGTASDSSIQDLYRALNGTYQDMTSEPPPPPPPLPSQKPLGGRNPPLYRSIKQEPQYTTYQYASQPSQSPRTSPGGSAYKPYTSIMPLAYNMNTQQPSHTATTHYQQLSPPPPPPLPPPPSQATCIQSAHSPPEFKLPSTPPPQTASSVYPMSSMQRTNMRSNSLPLCDKPMPQRRATEEVFAIPKLKHRNRSRSGSCLIQPGKSSTPTLISAGSDPAINTSQSPNALLHQLLTTNNNNCNAAPNYSYRAVTASNSMMDKSNTCMTTDTMGSLPGSMEPRAAASYSFSQNQNATAVHNINTDSNDSVELIMPDNQPVMYSSHSPSDTFTFSANVTTAALSRRMAKNQPMTAILSQSPSTTLIVNAPSPLSISAQHSPQMVGSASNSPKHPDSPGNDSLSLSPLNVGSPNSPNQKTGRRTYKEHRRVCHINAEQKRRCTIKNGFDMLHALIPQLNQNPNAKLSKAAMLQKGGEYIRQLRNERNQLKEEMDSLRQQVECLNSAISNCQSMLPATGAPVSRHRTSRMKEMYNEYIRSRTQENWRFWLLSLICEPLLVSFNNTVSTASLDDLYRTTLIWVEQHCSLVDLRPVVLNALRHLCTSTEFLSDPTKLPSEAQAAAMKSHSSNS